MIAPQRACRPVRVQIGGCEEVILNFHSVNQFYTLIHFHFFEYFILFKSLLKLSSRDIPEEATMVDTVNVARQMARNANLGITDFYLVENLDGKVEFAGTMDLESL